MFLSYSTYLGSICSFRAYAKLVLINYFSCIDMLFLVHFFSIFSFISIMRSNLIYLFYSVCLRPFFHTHVLLLLFILYLPYFHFSRSFCLHFVMHKYYCFYYTILFLALSILLKISVFNFPNISTIKPVYNNHLLDPKFVAVVDRWSLVRGRFTLSRLQLGLQNGGRCRQVVAIRRWSLAQVWLLLLYLTLFFGHFSLPYCCWDVSTSKNWNDLDFCIFSVCCHDNSSCTFWRSVRPFSIEILSYLVII
jgi:hypothetical protein